MKRSIVIVLVLLVAASAMAIGRRPVYGGFGFFELGAQKMDVDELNDKLDSSYGLELDDVYYTMGGGGYSVMGNLMLGGEGKGVFASSDSNDNRTVMFSGGYGMFNMGYMLYRNKNFGFYPKLGIGGGGMTLEIAEKGADFDDAIFGGMSRYANYATMLGDIAVGAIYTYNGLVFGLQGGYMHAFSEDEWVIADESLGNGPEIGMSGPYLKIMFGGGGFSR